MKRAQIRVDLFGEIAGQEAELLARLDGRAVRMMRRTRRALSICTAIATAR